MVASKLPRWFAVSGIVLGFTFMALYWYVYKYNPFDFPTAGMTDVRPGNYAPPIYSFLETAMFVICPGLLLTALFKGLNDVLGLIVWGIAALLNGPIYYLAGLILVSLMNPRGKTSAD
jgi:hypothetical protein